MSTINKFIAAVHDLPEHKRTELLYTMFEYTNEVYKFRTDDFKRTLEEIEEAIDIITPVKQYAVSYIVSAPEEKAA